MKKYVISLLAVVMVLFVVLPSQTLATKVPNNEEAPEIIENGTPIEDLSEVKKVEKYVSVDSEGHIVLNPKHSKNFHKKYDLEQLEAHFAFLNEKVDAGTIKINEDLSIQDLSFTTFAVYNKWTYHWWGYDRNFTNSQAISYANTLNSAAAIGGMTGAAAAAFMPIVGAGIAVSGGYYALLSSRVTANNKGRGVYVGMTWARVFNVKPL